MITALILIATLAVEIPESPKDSYQDLLIRSWISWGVVIDSSPMKSPDARYQPDSIDRILWTIWLAYAVDTRGRIHRNTGRVIIPPELVTAIARRESRLNPSAILPGCPRKGHRPRYCNLDGYPDVGLMQLHLNPHWSSVTIEDALNPRENLVEGVRQLRIHHRAHHGSGCQHMAESGSWPWEWAAKLDHGWLQHHNMGSRDHGKRVKRAWRGIRRRVKRQRDLPILPWKYLAYLGVSLANAMRFE